MINRLLTLLHSPYPVLVKRWKAVIIPSLIVFIILFLLQPFGISMMEGYKFWVVLGYGVVSSLALGVFVYLLPVALPRYYDEQHWTLGKELLGTLGACLLIAIGNWFYTAWWFGGNILSWRGFFISLIWVGILAPFPIVFFLMWNRNLQLARNLKEATEINFALAKKVSIRKEMEGAGGEEEDDVCCPVAEKPVHLVFSGGTKEMLEISANTLLYVEAEGNYVRVTYRIENKVQQRLLRATMKQAEEAVGACPFIIRCHRAFLVNVRTVVKVDGNSQGYRLRLEGCKDEVPVSRAYSKAVRMLIEDGSEG